MIPTDLTPAILQGHVVDILRRLPEASVQCVVTSPPYWGLRAYGTDPQVWGGNATHSHEWIPTSPRRPRSTKDVRNPDSIQTTHEGTLYEAQGGESCPCGAWRGELGLEPTPHLFVSHLADVFDEVRRVLRSDGTLWLNLGDTYTTHPAGLNGEKRWKASGLANRDNTGAEQAGSFDKRVEGGLPEKNLVGIPWRVVFELQDRGWWLRSDCVWSKPNPMPESVSDRPTRSHEYVFLMTKSARYFYDSDGVRRPIAPSTADRARNHLSNPLDNPTPDSKWGRNEWRAYPVIGRTIAKQDAVGKRTYEGFNARWEAGPPELWANLKSVWWIPTQPYPEAHFATFPEALAEICVRAGTSNQGACAKCGAPWIREVRAEGGTIGHDWHQNPERKAAGVADKGPVSRDGTYRRVDLGFRPACPCDEAVRTGCVVLDPFVGSGTVLAVARRLGRRSVGIELQPEYVALARRRCAADVPDLSRFEEAEA